MERCIVKEIVPEAAERCEHSGFLIIEGSSRVLTLVVAVPNVVASHRGVCLSNESLPCRKADMFDGLKGRCDLSR